jgi:hypothetical protein
VAHCRRLQESGIITAKYTRLYQSFAQELQAEINQDLMNIMESVELEDHWRFGKVRQAWEKEFRDPDDVFIHAKERRKEIAQQRKRSLRKKRSKGRSEQKISSKTSNKLIH